MLLLSDRLSCTQLDQIAQCDYSVDRLFELWLFFDCGIVHGVIDFCITAYQYETVPLISVHLRRHALLAFYSSL